MGNEPVPIRIVVGGQWGSEGKGGIAAALCEIHDIDYAVRTGAVNAGHTVYYRGTAYKMQQLPTGWVNPNTQMVIGAGAYINPEILRKETDLINTATNRSNQGRVWIDERAGLHTDHHTELSSFSGRHHSIGATGKGCSEAVIGRIKNRGLATPTLFKHTNPEQNLMDTEHLLNSAYDEGKSILLEGTQGQGLDLLLGPWPYTTHKPTSPGQWLVEAGLSPNLKLEIVMVVRTYPIRVAGNSGPMENETDWTEVAQGINALCRLSGMKDRVSNVVLTRYRDMVEKVGEEYLMKGLLPRWLDTAKSQTMFYTYTPAMRVTWAWALSEFHAEVFKRLSVSDVAELGRLMEFTTVTKKLRRVARWDVTTMRDSVRQIRPDYAVLTFLNYVFPELWGEMNGPQVRNHKAAMRLIRQREEEMGVEIKYVTTGPATEHLIEV